MSGKLLPSRTLLLKAVAAEAKTPDGRSYDCTTMVPGGTPIVTSGQTNRIFVLTWPEIITMAIAAGIDEPEPAEEGEES